MLYNYRKGAVAVEGLPACQHLIEHNAYGIDIRPLVGHLSPCLLRRDIADRADGPVGHRLAVDPGEAGDAEIHDLYRAVGEQHDVLGLDVPVYDAFIVGVLQSSDYLGDEVERVLPFEDALLLDELLERDPVDILHNDELNLLGKAHIVDLNDVRVGENSDSLALVPESSQEFIIIGIFWLEYLDGNGTIFHYVSRFIDVSHSADSYKLGNFISAVKLLTDVRIHLIQLLYRKLT